MPWSDDGQEAILFRAHRSGLIRLPMVMPHEMADAVHHQEGHLFEEAPAVGVRLPRAGLQADGDVTKGGRGSLRPVGVGGEARRVVGELGGDLEGRAPLLGRDGDEREVRVADDRADGEAHLREAKADDRAAVDAGGQHL